MTRSVLLLVALSLGAAASAPAFAQHAAASTPAPAPTTAVEVYVANSLARGEVMVSAMHAFGADRESMEKAMGLMEAVQAFDGAARPEFESAQAAAQGRPALLAALQSFRDDQATLARRMLNQDESLVYATWAQAKALAQKVRDSNR